MENNRKKVIISLVIVITLMFLLLGGATYAYFVTNTRNRFGTKTITGTADATGSVALVGTNASLYLNIGRNLMAQGANDTTYWAVTTNTTPSTTQNVVTVGSTQVTGAGYYNCSYTLNVAASGTNNMYTAFQGMTGKSTGQIVLNIGGNTYDFNTSNLFPITVNGTLNGVTSSSVQNITAEFYLKNKSNVNQSALAGKDITLTITATSFTCTQVEDPNDYLDKAKIRLHSNAYGNNSTSLVFMNTTNVPIDNSCGNHPAVDVSQKQNGSIMMSFDSDNCTLDDVTYYIGQSGGVLAPSDSSHLFDNTFFTIFNFNNFDTSHVTDMSYMFADFRGTSLNLSGFSTSNVTNMEGMFSISTPNNNTPMTLDVTGWNTSNVTNMSFMFYHNAKITSLDLSHFNVSNVTNMEQMFSTMVNLTTLDLTSWNTSNVTNMFEMMRSNTSLVTIYASNSFVTTSLGSGMGEGMFDGSNVLTGGAGTTYYNYGEVDHYAARIDNPPDYPGYFTLRS